MSSSAETAARVHDWHSPAQKKHLRKRYAADRRLQLLGLGAIGIAVLLLAVLVTSLVMNGYQAFVQTHLRLELNIDAGKVKADAPEKGNYRTIVNKALRAQFPEVKSRRERSALGKILSRGAQYRLRDYVVAHPEVIGTTIYFDLPVSDPFDQLNKNVIPRTLPALSRKERRAFRALENRGVITDKNGKAEVLLDIYLNPNTLGGENVSDGAFKTAMHEGLLSYFYPAKQTALLQILAPGAEGRLRQYLADHPQALGKTVRLGVPVSAHYQTLHNGQIPVISNPRFKSPKQIAWFDQLVSKDLVSTPFNWALFFSADSRFPELAGLSGAISGSFYTLLVCFLISFPMGIAAAVYLEEFAVRNRFTDMIEVNINNLAAVPSVVFGLLGLAVFLGWFGLPRSAPLVGGMVLSLMTLPTIIIATRAALKAVPPSIREAALGVGASKHQVMMHHVLPLAMPGILTGTIIGLAQALGETAPLLLIGMNAFITSAAGDIMEPATALPTQIYSWADSPERGFVARTSAAILVLLGFLVLMNGIAIFMRQKFEKTW
ncbi:MAG: phosphate ABC transporter, permease protein PstA [Hyphomicrobiales bacterium]|nr:MAG: phosphate ABC transporter, permease protein PstA [Hyphomicrobiales bacterium]